MSVEPRPGTAPLAPAGPGLEDLGALDLLFAAVIARQTRATHAVPRRGAELQSAVVAVAGVDVPVAAGLALGDLVPDAVGRGRAGAALDDLRPRLGQRAGDQDDALTKLAVGIDQRDLLPRL